FHCERGRPRWGLLLLVVLGLAGQLARNFWLDTSWLGGGLILAITVAAVTFVFKAPRTARHLAALGLILFGLYGVALGLFWPNHVPLPSAHTDIVSYGLVYLDGRPLAIAAGLEGLALSGFGLWLVPRVIDDRTRALFRSASDIELAHRAIRLTRTRT